MGTSGKLKQKNGCTLEYSLAYSVGAVSENQKNKETVQ